MFSSRSLWSLLGLCALLCTGGCASYKLGPTGGQVAGEKSVQIDTFQNETMEPRLSDYVTASLRKKLQQDGTFTLDTKNTADIVITGKIIRFHRSELTFQPTDVRTVRDYYLSMTAQITATERETGKKIFSRNVSGRTSLRVGADLASAERQAVPLLADDLARNASSLITDGIW